jgi:metallophosphoesterase superfamily enzyme
VRRDAVHGGPRLAEGPAHRGRPGAAAPLELAVRVGDEPRAVVHHPDIATSQPAIGGHVHPVASIRDFDGASVRVPAFVKDPRRLILPSFGNFTGGHAVSAQPGRELLLVMAGRVIAAQR